MSITISEPHLSAQETAQRLGVTIGRIYQLAKDGRLDSLKIGYARLFPLSAVEAFQLPKRGRNPQFDLKAR